MREVIPTLGKTRTSKRLDELFSRETLGAVLFGAAASKIVEKANFLVVSFLIIYFYNIEVGPRLILTGILLLVWWTVELFLFIYLYIKWEKTIERITEAAEAQKEKVDKAKEEVDKKGKKEEPDVLVSIFGREIEFNIGKSNK